MNNVNNELADFFRVLKENGCFHDETKPAMDAMSEIEKKLKFDDKKSKEKQK